MTINGSIADIATELHGSVDAIVPGGSVGDVMHGVLHIPVALIYFVANVFLGFGS